MLLTSLFFLEGKWIAWLALPLLIDDLIHP